MKHIFYFISIGLLFSCGNAEKEKTIPVTNTVVNNEQPQALMADSTTSADNTTSLPDAIGRINDFENIFTPEQEQELDQIISAFENKTGNQIGIITVANTGTYTDFKKYSVDLFNHWGVGLKDKNNGLLITFSAALRSTRITTGLGTEKVLTNALCKKIIDEKMIPEFKSKNFFNGIKAGLQECIVQWK